MKAVFADTSYYLALLNGRDRYHTQAVEATRGLKGKIVTTAWVLTEIADAFCKPDYRQQAGEFLRELMEDKRVVIMRPTWKLFEQGLEFFQSRPDKDWSLTDCISFLVMSQRHLKEALTADHHFEQAGFTILLR